MTSLEPSDFAALTGFLREKSATTLPAFNRQGNPSDLLQYTISLLMQLHLVTAGSTAGELPVTESSGSAILLRQRQATRRSVLLALVDTLQGKMSSVEDVQKLAFALHLLTVSMLRLL